MYYDTFGNNLRYYRVKSHITQQNLGQRTGLHRTYISALEHGAANPTLKTIVKLAEGLNISPSFLLTPRIK